MLISVSGDEFLADLTSSMISLAQAVELEHSRRLFVPT